MSEVADLRVAQVVGERSSDGSTEKLLVRATIEGKPCRFTLVNGSKITGYLGGIDRWYYVVLVVDFTDLSEDVARVTRSILHKGSVPQIEILDYETDLSRQPERARAELDKTLKPFVEWAQVVYFGNRPARSTRSPR